MKTKNKRWYIIIAVIAIIIAGFVVVGNYTDRLVDPFVRSLLEETKPMGHNIEYGKIRVSLFSGSITVEKVRIFPEDTLSENKVRFNIEVESIKLTDFEFWQLVMNKNLQIQDFVIDDPNVNIILPVKTADAINEVKERQEPKPKEQLLKNVFLEKIIISGGNFKLYRSDTLLAQTTDIQFLAQEINLKRNSLDEPIGYTFSDISLSLKNIDLNPQSGLYDMKLGSLLASKKDSSIVLENFKVIPKYDKREYSKKIKFQNDRFDLTIGRIEIADIGLERWMNGEALNISKLLIEGLDADIYRDKNVPADMNRFPLFYNESFLKLKIPVYIDSVLVTNSKILYGELALERDKAGTILLEDFNVQMFDLTNNVDADSIENFMAMNVQAKIMGEGQMNIELALPLQGDLHKFSCMGSVGAMELKPLNDMLEPAINITFNGGKLDRMAFAFTANDNVSDGWMEFLFSGLDVALLKKDAEKQWGFVSLMANAVAMSNNPVDGKDLKVVEIGFERDKNKGIINYVYKTIQSGMVRTIIPTNKYRIKQKQEEGVNQQAKTGENKKEKKNKKKG